MLVMKFGGTSVGDGARIGRVADLALRYRDRNPVVVTSAMTGVTDLLLTTIHEVARGESGPDAHLTELMERHVAAVDACIANAARRDAVIGAMAGYIEYLRRMYLGVSLLGETTLQSLDTIASYGERLSSLVLAAAIEERDVPARAMDASRFLITDSNFGAANPLPDQAYPAIRAALLPLLQEGIIPVVTGFIGGTAGGRVTTLGRGGSDYSATLLGGALDAQEVWIWTDVDGVMTADPRIVPQAVSLAEISYAEAAELAYFGAKVIHPKTVLPAIRKSIPVRILNTFNPDFVGTLIVSDSVPAHGVVKAITCINNLSLVTVEGAGMIGVPGIAAKVFGAVARRKSNVLMISQSSSEHSICFVVEKRDTDAVIEALQEEFALDLIKQDISTISAERDIAIISCVGGGMKGTWGVAGKLFGTLGEARINIIAIAQGSSELNLSIVVSSGDRDEAIRVIHRAFIG